MNHISPKNQKISSQIKMNKLFKTTDEIKVRICDKSIHKAMRIPVEIHQTNKHYKPHFPNIINIKLNPNEYRLSA